MSEAREAILAAVRAALPPAVEPPPAMEPFERTGEASLAETFVAAATAAGASVARSDRSSYETALHAIAADAGSVLSFASALPSTFEMAKDPHELAGLDLLVCESALGVAENGAVWLATSDPIVRGALFLAQRVLVVVGERDLVRDLHEAYARLDVRANPFGVFVAGPSKTADIEQALVIGAHGPKAFTVLLVRDDDAGRTA